MTLRLNDIIIKTDYIYFRAVGNRVGVSKSTAWKCTMRTCFALVMNGGNYISWKFKVFEKDVAFPNTIGAVDVCEIPISALRDNMMLAHGVLMKFAEDYKIIITYIYQTARISWVTALTLCQDI